MDQGDILDGRYRIEALLGQGGFGTAWRAHDLRIDRPVAVKIGSPGSPDAAQRLVQEARLAGSLSHPNVAAIHDVGQLDQDGTLMVYIVMEFVPGENLARVVARGLPPFPDTVAWARQICAALAAAHDAGIVHRDITPANLQLTDGGTIKVLDFGIAKRQDAWTTLTADGAVVGSFGYMAPERLTGGPVDGRSDLYALGCVLAELWTGRPPFQAVDVAALMNQHMNVPPTPPSLLRSGLPPAADRLVLDLLAKRPDHRPHDAREVERRLEQLATESSAPTVTATAAAAPASRLAYRPTVADSTAGTVRSALRRRLDQIVALPPDADQEEFLGLLDGLVLEAQRELGPDDPLTAEAMAARALRAGGESLDRIIAKLTRVFGPEHPRTVHARVVALGPRVHDGAGEYFREYEGIIALAVRVLGPHDPVTLYARLQLAAGRSVVHTPTGPVHLPLVPVGTAHSPRRRAAYEPLLPDLARGLPDDRTRYEAQARVAVDAHMLEDHAAAARYYDELLPLARRLDAPHLPLVLSLQHAHSVGESGDPARAVAMLDELLERLYEPELQHRARKLRARFRRRARRTGSGRSWLA